MKKILILLVLVMMVVSSLVGIASETTSNKDAINISVKNVSNENFTHAVFVEYATTTWCPSCPTASEALYSIYQSGDYPLYYMSLISDVNPIAQKRSRAYNTIVIPSAYIDGGDLNYFGNAGSAQATENVYRSLIEERGINEDIHSIDMDMDVTWDGDAEMTVTINIENKENSFYFGIIRSYVTEVESRWLDYKGDPYYFGLLDIPINKLLFLLPQGTKVISFTWDGKESHGDQTFEDITEDNIMVISTVCHWMPHLRQGYQDPPYDQKYLGFFVDQTVGAMPESN
jgi:thiol-disulfide isomerase/thioredoxin